MAKLKQAKLSDLCFLVTDGTHDSPKLLKKGYPLIKGKDINQGYINFENCDYISLQDHLKVISRSKPEYSDILFANIGNSIGDLAYVNTTREFSIKNVALIKPDKSKIDNLYLYYYMLSPIFQDKIKSIKQGAAQPFISLNLLRNFEITIINNIAIQNKIAKILSNYDDLIENNNRRIKILEEIAQKIYKEWFVDFKFPGHETATFKDSPLGKIPNDWTISNLENILSCIESGSRPKGGINSNDTEIPSIGAENIIGLGKYDYNKEKYISDEFYKKMKRGKIQSLDVLLYKDGAQLGRKSIFGENFPHSKCCVNEHVFILRTNEKCSQYYLFFTLDTVVNTEKIKQLNTNAAQPGINQAQVNGLTIILAQRNIIEKFDVIISPIVSEIFKLCIKNQTLKQTRDILLPRLISGEIDVENMEIL